MSKIRIGIICPSEIAFRRFMPAIQKCENASYAGIAYANAEEWFGDSVPSAAACAALQMGEKGAGARKAYLSGKAVDNKFCRY